MKTFDVIVAKYLDCLLISGRAGRLSTNVPYAYIALDLAVSTTTAY